MSAEPGLASGLGVVESAGQAAALLAPLRRRLLEQLREPASASGLARRLGLPRQKVNYHLRELEKKRLVELVEERRSGNCTERVLRATARSYVISPAALGGLAADPGAVRDRFSSAYLVAATARAVREVGDLRGRAERAGRRVATLTVEAEARFASAADRSAFAEELTAQLARLIDKYHREKASGGRPFRFLIAGYPAVPRPDSEGEP
jgi:DNA-binding transcriptional ArsR family regulator